MRFFVKGAPHIRMMFLSEVPRIEYKPLWPDMNPYIAGFILPLTTL